MKNWVLISTFLAVFCAFSQEKSDSIFTVYGKISGAEIVACNVFIYSMEEDRWIYIDTYYFKDEYKFEISKPGALYSLFFKNKDQEFDLLVISGEFGEKSATIEFNDDPEMKKSSLVFSQHDSPGEYILSRLK